MTSNGAAQPAAQSLAAFVHAETRKLIIELLEAQDGQSLFTETEQSALHTVLGVALAYAALWRFEGDDVHRAAALELTARYLCERGSPRRLPRPIARLRTSAPWNSREAIEAGSTLGWILLALKPSLSPEEEGSLSALVLRTQTTLRAAGALDFYINGNYAIPLCELAYLWSHLRGGADSSSYEHCWRLLVHPASLGRRWDGYGWITVAAPSDPDWLDAEGYFTETPGYCGRSPRNTFDPEYSQLQLERLVRLWLLTGDPRALRHIRAIHAMLLNHLDREHWTLGVPDASRTSGSTQFFNPATCLLALHSPHGEVAADFALEQFQGAVLSAYRRNCRQPGPYLLRGFGTILTPLLLMSAPRGRWSAPLAPMSGDDTRSPGAQATSGA